MEDGSLYKLYRSIVAAERERVKRDLHKRGLRFPMEAGFQDSALIQRLGEGKRAFVIPPPLHDRVPWYDVIESERPIELVTLSLVPSRAGQQILINGDDWRVLRVIGRYRAEVTYMGWQELGFVWRLECKTVDSAGSRYQICLNGECAFTDSDVRDLLYRECERISAGNAALASRKEKMMHDMFAQIFRRNATDSGFQIVDGRVHVRRWEIQRISPAELNDSIYWPV